MASLTEHYEGFKAGIGSIDPADAAQLMEDWFVVAATGAGVGLISGAIGGLDHKIAGFTVPVDGLISGGLGLAGLVTKNHYLKLASVAAGGSAAVRTFERFFKAGFHMKGEFEDLGSGMMGISGHRFHGNNQLPAHMYGPGVGFGVSAQERLVEAAKFL